jgi:hypothetical protein
LKPKSKVPVGEDWAKQPVATFDELDRRCKGHNVGVRLGEWSKIGGLYLHVIDVDIRSAKFEEEARAALAKMMIGYPYETYPRVKSGSGGPSFHVYFLTDKPFKSKKLAQSEGFRLVKEKSSGKEVKKRNWEIELFGTGKQVTIPPSIHPETGNVYEWEIEFDPTADCPYVESTDIEALVRDEEVSTGSDDITGITVEDAKEYLSHLDLDYWCEDREGWIKLGMAIHHEFEGSDEGFKLWCEFAKQSAKFDLREHKAQWKSFKNRGGRPTTFRTIIEASNENQWATTYEALPDMFDDIEEDEAEEDVDPDRRPIPKNIADEFDDLPSLKGEAKRKEIVRRKGDPNMTILEHSSVAAPKIPIEGFHPRIRRIVRDGAKSTGSPEDFVFSAFFTGVAMCLGNSVELQARKNFVQPAILWCQNIGIPSSNKSPALRVITHALDRITARQMGPYQEAFKIWQAESERAAIHRKEWAAQQKAIIASGEATVIDMPREAIAPRKPPLPLIYMNDMTIEAFHRRQASTDRGVGVVRDELATWMGNMERYSSSSDRGSWLEAYDAGSHRMERVKDEGEVTFIPRVNASIIGNIQPEKLLTITSLESSDDGLQARFLPFWPDRVKRSFFDEVEDIDDVEPILDRLYALPMEKDSEGAAIPYRLHFSKKAHRVYGEWYDRNKQGIEFKDARLQGIFGKADGQVVRLALLIEHAHWAADDFSDDPPATVSEDSVKLAIQFYDQYVRPMQMRVFSHAIEPVSVQNARRIANHIIENGLETVNQNKLRREAGIRGINANTEATVVEQAIGVLVEMNWLIASESESGARGRPKKEFKVNPRVWENVK